MSFRFHLLTCGFGIVYDDLHVAPKEGQQAEETLQGASAQETRNIGPGKAQVTRQLRTCLSLRWRMILSMRGDELLLEQVCLGVGAAQVRQYIAAVGFDLFYSCLQRVVYLSSRWILPRGFFIPQFTRARRTEADEGSADEGQGQGQEVEARPAVGGDAV